MHVDTTRVSRPQAQLPDPASSGIRAAAARARAVDFLRSHRVAAADGSGHLLHGPMRGRVLDTALTLHVLRTSGLHLPWQERLRAFLVDNLAAADRFSATVARAVLARVHQGSSRHDDTAYSTDLNRILEGLRHARSRKMALLGTILAELSAIPFEAVDFDPDVLSDEVAHLFSQIYFAALKLCHGRHRGASAADLAAEVAVLVETQAPNGSWEQQSLLTLIALIALGPQHPAFAPGLAFLQSVTRDDGGVAFCDNLNLWTTALAGLALFAGVDSTGPDGHTVAGYILAQQQRGGGWGFSEHVLQADTDTADRRRRRPILVRRAQMGSSWGPDLRDAGERTDARRRP